MATFESIPQIETLNKLSFDGKMVALRAIANSAAYRLFWVADLAHRLRAEAEGDRSDAGNEIASPTDKYREVQRKANDLAMVYQTCKNVIQSRTSEKFWFPMEAEKVMELVGQADTRGMEPEVLKMLALLAEKTEDQVKSDRNTILSARAAEGRKAAERAGGDFEAHLMSGDCFEEFEQAVDAFHAFCPDFIGLVLKKLKEYFDSKYRMALEGRGGSGLADLFLIKDDIKALEAARNFDL